MTAVPAELLQNHQICARLAIYAVLIAIRRVLSAAALCDGGQFNQAAR